MTVTTPSFAKRPPSAYMRADKKVGLHVIRDQFTITTWLLLGAVFQSLLFLLPVRAPYLLGAASALLGVKFIDHLLMIVGVKRNVYLDGTVEGYTTARFPLQDGAGNVDEKSADSDEGKIAVVLLGIRVNHPLGMLAPGFSTIGTFFDSMSTSLEEQASTNGFLGASTYLNATDRSTSSEIMTVFYFDSMESVSALAHGPAHREGWDWWNRTVKENRHLGIYHEVYEAPRGKWEILYENHHATGAAATSHRVVDGERDERWVGALRGGGKDLRVKGGKLGMQRVSVDVGLEAALEV